MVELVTMAQRSTSSKCARLSSPCPKKKSPCFKFFLTKHIQNAPTCAFHQNLFLSKLVTMAQRSRSIKSARLSAPQKRPHVSDFFEPSIFGRPQLVPFTRTCFWSNWSQWLRDPGPQSVLDYPPPPPPKRPHVSDFFEPSIFGMPQPIPFTTTCFWSNWSQWLRDPGPQSVLDYPPPLHQKAPCFRFFFNQAYLECPNLYLSPQPVFGRIGRNGSEI